MTSPSPLLYDTYYHIYNRGVNGENIFFEERNYEHFLNLYAKHLEPVCDLFAYCMLRNHFHVSLRVKSEEEIIEYKETLRVSPAIGRPVKHGSLANQNEDQLRKPLEDVLKVNLMFSQSFSHEMDHSNKHESLAGLTQSFVIL